MPRQAGGGREPEVHELAWGASLTGHALDPQRRCFDLLIASDVCYDEARHTPSTRRITMSLNAGISHGAACQHAGTMQRC